MPGCTHGDIFGFAVSTGDICFSVAFHLQIQRQEQAIYPDSSRSSSLPDRLPFFHKGSIALKTGSVSSVQAYAGYKLDSKGKPTHVVVILVNGFFCPRKQVREGAESLLINLFDK